MYAGEYGKGSGHRRPSRPGSDDRRGPDGFTIVELLAAMLVIAVLATIALPVFLTQRERAAEAAVQSDLRNAGALQLAEMHDREGPATSLTELEDWGFRLSPGVEIVNADDFTSGDGEFCMAGRAERGSGQLWSVNSVRGTVIAVPEPC